MKIRYHDPLPTRAAKKQVYDFAERVAEELDYQPGLPIEAVVSQAEGSITYRNAVGDKPESILVEPDGEFEIFLPTMTSMSRDRFTIAHELGHLYLHFPLVQRIHPGDGMRAYRWVDDSDEDLQRCEWEANWFAAAFTMPEQLFRELVDSDGIEIAAIELGVSERAARVRARTLGIA